MEPNPLHKLESLGQSVWVDFLRRGMLRSGDLRRLVEQDGVRGVTSNPSIFEKAISGSRDYDEAIRVLALAGRDDAAIYQSLVTEDIGEAADILRDSYDQTGGRDGFISLEVSPHLARDTEGTVSEARRLWAAVNRPNLMIKVPGTREGLPAIRRLIGEGINVNITLLFGLPRYRQVVEAYLAGLEDLDARGGRLDRAASVASFFLSRIDVLVDPMLDARMQKGGPDAEPAKALVGRTAIASAKIAYAVYREMFEGERFQTLAAKGARTQRLLWASTSTKNPAYSDVKYVEPLIGPDTINTMPLETLEAYRDHGNPAYRLAEGLDDARAALQGLADLGISIDQATQQLEDEGIDKFNKPFDKLMLAIQTARLGALREPVDRQVLELGGLDAPVRDRIRTFEAERFASRLWDKDPSLWKKEPEAQKIIRGALGWLHVAEKMAENLGTLEAFAAEVKAAGFRHVLHMGMGGSSMVPLVFERCFPVGTGGLPLTVLDGTNPATVLRIERSLPLEDTLFIVASKSGTTAEPKAFGDYFYAKLRERKGDRAGGNFVAITDPGTPLAQEAAERRYRRVFLNYSDIGGRFSALSFFGLLPAVLMGIDAGELVERALRMANACSAFVPEKENPGLALGAAMGELARLGRDKITLLTPDSVSTLGLWLEQLIAESTGKEGRGILPVAEEDPGDPGAYGNDRLFVVLQFRASPSCELDEAAAGLKAAGFPLVTIYLEDVLDLGQEFFRWEIATAAAGSALGINAFDQPNVAESKANTNRLLAAAREQGGLPEEKPALVEGPLSFYAGPSGKSGREILRAFLQSAKPGDYFAIQAYLPESPKVNEALQAMRLFVRDSRKLATTLGYGPRFLHSTGQYHKGGPNTGIFLQLTADNPEDAPIPGEPYTFGIFERAQARGDLEALQQHGRRVLRIHMTGNLETALARLDELLGEAMALRPAAPAKPPSGGRPAAAKSRTRKQKPRSESKPAPKKKSASGGRPAPRKKPASRKSAPARKSPSGAGTVKRKTPSRAKTRGRK